MAEGAGKYDDITTLVREKTGAVAVMVIVIEGDKGNGFSIQSQEPDVQHLLPILLRQIAAQIEIDNLRKLS